MLITPQKQIMNKYMSNIKPVKYKHYKENITEKRMNGEFYLDNMDMNI